MKWANSIVGNACLIAHLNDPGVTGSNIAEGIGGHVSVFKSAGAKVIEIREGPEGISEPSLVTVPLF